MVKIIDPLAWNVPIVDPKTGYPTEYFKRILEDISEARISASLIEALGGDPDEDQVVTWDDAAGDLAFKPASDVLDMLGTEAHGDIIYRDADDWALLPAGTDGEVLTTHGAGADPTWETPAAGGGAFTLISEFVSDGTVATHTFSSIPGTYKSLRLEYNCRSSLAVALDSMTIEINGDAGANYDIMTYVASGNVANVTTGAILAGTAAAASAVAIPGASATAGFTGTGFINFPDYSDTVFNKVYFGENTYRTTNTTAGLFLRVMAYWWRNTAAITQLKVTLGANFVSGSTVKLYGVS